jgi:hypothetical protein
MKAKDGTTMQATSSTRNLLPASPRETARGLPEVSAHERNFWRREVARARERIAAGLPVDTFVADLN